MLDEVSVVTLFRHGREMALPLLGSRSPPPIAGQCMEFSTGPGGREKKLTRGQNSKKERSLGWSVEVVGVVFLFLVALLLSLFQASCRGRSFREYIGVVVF